MEIPRHWRLKTQRYRLEGSTCPVCGRLTFPPRPVCPPCTGQPVPNAGGQLTVMLTSAGLNDIQSSIGYQILERM